MRDRGAETIPREDLVLNVRKTVQTAVEVLEHLEQTLERGHFAEGMESYRAMCDTLVGQRLWSLTINDEIIDQSFNHLSDVANRIADLLGPYVKIMERLRAAANASGMRANAIGVGSPASGQLPADAVKVVEILRGQKALSFGRLRSLSELDRKRLTDILADLQTLGLVDARTAGGRKTYAAGPSGRQSKSASRTVNR